MAVNDKYTYLYKLLPNIPYVYDCVMKDFGTTKSGEHTWYEIFDESDNQSGRIVTDAYRGIYISNKELSFAYNSDANILFSPTVIRMDTSFDEYPYVYAVFSGENNGLDHDTIGINIAGLEDLSILEVFF